MREACRSFLPTHIDDVYVYFLVNTKKPRPSSVAVSTPSRLITLSEAQNRLHDHPAQQSEERSSSYNGEEGSDIIPVFHTVIDFE